MTLDILKTIAAYCGSITAIAACVALLVKPIREKLFGLKQHDAEITHRLDVQDEAIRCLLRRDILDIYFKHQDDETLTQVEAEFISQTYQSYKKLGGNSFVDRLVAEMRTWKIV